MGKLDRTIKSSKFAESRVIMQGGQILLDMRGDERLDNLIDEVKSYISENGLKVPEDQKQICTKIAELMRMEKYYGPYGEISADMQAKLAQATQRYEQSKLDVIHNIPDDFTPKEKEYKIRELKQEQKELEVKIEDLTVQLLEDGAINSLPLRDVKTGDTICFQQAAVMSCVMGNVGLPNDLCLGVGPSQNFRGFGHLYVQSRSGDKDIIDSTTFGPHGSVYWHNLNGAQISKGEVVLTAETVENGRAVGGTLMLDYGAGSFGPLNWLFKSEQLKELVEQLKPETRAEWLEVVTAANRRKANDDYYDKEEKDKDTPKKERRRGSRHFKKGNRFSDNEAGDIELEGGQQEAEYAKADPSMVDGELAANLQEVLVQDAQGKNPLDNDINAQKEANDKGRVV